MVSARTPLAAAVAALLLSACAVGPDYRAPQTATASFVRADPATVSSERSEARWWTLFGDAALSGLVEQALAANLDLRIALTRV